MITEFPMEQFSEILQFFPITDLEIKTLFDYVSSLIVSSPIIESEIKNPLKFTNSIKRKP